MILGFISDAHGNVKGVEKCLSALNARHVEQVYFLGDSVGYLPDDDRVLHRLGEAGAICIRGNHEEMLLGNLPFTAAMDAAYRIMDARRRVLPKWAPWFMQWPIRRELVIDDARILLVHGSPRDPVEESVYPDSDLTPFRDLPFDFVLSGHTHRPFVRNTGSLTYANAGSCGLPRDVGNLASCAVFDSTRRSVEILRVEFDAGALTARLRNQIAESVAACLMRKPAGPVVGTIIDA